MDSVCVGDQMVQDLLLRSGTVWKFNHPHSSHMSGAWELMIGVVRRVLDSMLLDLKSAKLTHEVLATLMAQVCAIINARPLVPVSTDVQFPSVLSPASLLTQKVGEVPDQLPELDVKDMYRSQWRFAQVLASTFWTRWRREYLQSLQVRRKRQSKSPDLAEGDVVILEDKDQHRNHWPLGWIKRVL